MAKYYIAYGSNMDEEQMAYRCPMAQLLGRIELEDYCLLFKGSKRGAYATIEPEEAAGCLSLSGPSKKKMKRALTVTRDTRCSTIKRI